jgi:hypothetical protein
MFQKKSDWEVVREFAEESKNDDIRLKWEYNHYMLMGEQLLYWDTTNKRIVVLRPGTQISHNGKVQPVPYSVLNYPTDNHLGTISRSISAQAMANELMLEAGAVTGEDEDKDAALNSTYVLQYFFNKLKMSQKREQVTEYQKPCGSCFAKVWWDPEIGDPVGEDDQGQPIKGDPNVIIIPSQAMMLPSGVTNFDDIETIGHKQAMSVDKIFSIWGKKVNPEHNLKDPKKLATIDGTASELKNHAMVYEVFVKPSKEYPQGRHIIAANEVILDSNPFDPELVAKFPNRWHPYVFFRWLIIGGEIWPKSLVDDLVPLQREVNKLTKQISESKKMTRPIVIHSKTAGIDWNKVQLEPETGYPRIEATDIGGVRLEWPRNFNQDLEARKASLIERMNDMAASWPATRGQPTSSVTSGEQAKEYKQAANSQMIQLLQNHAEGFIEVGQRILELCAVHFPSAGRLIKITGKNNESIAFTFTPDQVRSENIILSNGHSFFLMPAEQRAETERLVDKGWYGNMEDPLTQAKIFKQMKLPAPEGMFDSIMNDYTMAQRENRLFKEGKLEETDPFIIQQIQQEYQTLMEEWTAKAEAFAGLEEWQVKAQQYEEEMQIYQAALNEYQTKLQSGKGKVTFPGPPPVNPGPPPEDPGPQPEPPKPWRRARREENGLVHIEEHQSMMKSTEFESLCLEHPELREAMYFHIDSHLQLMAENKMREQQIMQPIPAAPVPQ